MLNSNATCSIRRHTGYDVYGKPKFAPSVTERCAVVKLRSEQQHTTVRADSSQSRGHADEFVSTNNFLLDAKTVAALDDQVTIRGIKIRLMTMGDRYDTNGRLDHFECTGELWA